LKRLANEWYRRAKWLKQAAMNLTRKQLIILAAVFIATRIICFLLVSTNWTDISIYSQYAQNILGGQTPYKEFTVEYPPIALLIFVIPGLLAKILGSYRISYRLFMMIFDLGCLFLISGLLKHFYWSEKSRQFRAVLLYLILTGLSFQFLYDRFDIVLSFLILLSAYLAIVRKNWLGAYLILWIAIFTKLFPLILIPLYYMIESRNTNQHRKPLVDLAVAAVAGIAFGFIVSLWLGPWWESIISYHGGRGIQIESIYGTVAIVAGLVGVPYKINHDFGSFNIENSFTPYLVSISPFIALAAIIFGYYLVYRWISDPGYKSHSSQVIIPSMLVILLMFILGNKVLSPQYLLWLFPLAALTYNDSKIGTVIFICWLCAAVSTTILFPYNYPDMVMQKFNGIIWLFLRNLSLLALAVFYSIKTIRVTIQE
jgi:hypothetical protein